MTVKLLSTWGGQPVGTLFTASTATETAMVTAKVATADLTGGVSWIPPGSNPGVGTGGGANLKSAAVFLPPTDDYDGIMVARAAAIANGGGVVKLKPIRYPSFGNRSIPLVSGVSYIGEMPVMISPNSGAPDVGAQFSTGTVLEADGNTSVFAGRTVPGLEFTGTLVNGVLTVATTVVSDQTGVVGFLDAGSNIRQLGVLNSQIFIVAQLTSTEPGGELGKRGTYSVMTPSAQNITNPPAITAGNTWRCEYLSGITIKDIGFLNCKKAVEIGAFATQGCSWSHFENLHSYRTTAEPYDLLNFEHISVEGLYSFECFHGPRLAMWSARENGGLGNSVINKVYNYTNNNRLGRGIVLGSPLGNPGAGAGTMYYTHIQNNHFNRDALDVSFTLTSGNANIAVPSGQMAQFPLDVSVRFISSLGGFAGGAIGSGNRPSYFVVAQDLINNTVQLSINPRGSAVVPNASGAVTTRSYGLPAIVISGTADYATKMDARGLDMEGQGNICLLNYVSPGYARNLLFTDLSEEALCIRNCSSLTFETLNDVTVDISEVGTSSTVFLGSARVNPIAPIAAIGGASPVGFFRDGLSGGGFSMNLSLYRGSGGLPTFGTREPGGATLLAIGSAVAFRGGSSSATALSLNNGSNESGYGTFRGTAPAVWTWTPTPAASFLNLRQVFKNGSKTAGATLTITLSASSGTFDGLTGGSSAGKSIVLQPSVGTTGGGCLVMICVQTGASTYEWSVESLTNGAVL